MLIRNLKTTRTLPGDQTPISVADMLTAEERETATKFLENCHDGRTPPVFDDVDPEDPWH